MEVKEIKEKIEETKRKISELEEKLEEIETDIKKAQEGRLESTRNATEGLFMLNNDSPLQAMGTYKYVKGTMGSESYKNVLAELRRNRDYTDSRLFDEKMRLQRLEEEFEYESRPEASLIDEKEGLFVEGDDLKSNLLSNLYDTLNQYVAEYNALVTGNGVDKYCELTSQVMQSSGYEALPKNIPQNEEILKTYRTKGDFKMVVVGDRILVDSDFITPKIKDEEDILKYYERKISEQKARLSDFSPSGLGRVFSKVRDQQKSELSREIDYEVRASERRITYGREDISSFEEDKKRFIEPSVPFFEIVRQIDELEQSGAVRKFISEGETYRENIQNKTILKNGLDYGNFIAKVILKNKVVLDKLGVKLTRDQLLRAIYDSEYHAEIAAELKNAGYRLSQTAASKNQDLESKELGEE